MRISSTVLLKDQRCVQSYGWNYFRPLGNLQTAVDEIEAYECDEIAIVRPVRQNDTRKTLFRDIEIIQSLKCATPVSFGGGIRDIGMINHLKRLPVERLIFSSAFLSMNNDLIKYVLRHFGRQSVQCFLPVISDGQNCKVFNSENGVFQQLSDELQEYISKNANEIIIHDCLHEGSDDTFDWNLLNCIDVSTARLVVSGGLGYKTINTAMNMGIASVLIDNKTLHIQHSVAGFRYAANM